MGNKKIKNVSLWEDTCSLKRYPALEGVAGCDVLVIGGGMAGLLTAHSLANQGVNVILAEGGRIGRGTTGGTTAKITSQHGLIYQRLVKEKGRDAAALYLKANEDAVLEYAKLCSGRECGFQRKSNFIYSRQGKEVLEAEMEALDIIGFKGARFHDHLNLPFSNDGAVEFPLQACFHPLKMIKKLTETDAGADSGFRILENTRITSLRRWHGNGWEAVSERGTILSDQVVMATHFPFMDRRGGYFVKMHQNRSLVIAGAADAAETLEGMYMDQQEGGISLREGEGMLLLGGGCGRPGKVRGSWEQLESLGVRYFAGWETRYRWAAQDCMTLDGIPYIGSYYGNVSFAGESPEPGLWVASGFNKWGMTGSMVSAMILSDLICGKENPYAEVFRSDRRIYSRQLLANGAESALGLLTPSVPRCRHLGCALKWNEAERAWECSCHGSRYDEIGRCTEGPSVKDLF